MGYQTRWLGLGRASGWREPVDIDDKTRAALARLTAPPRCSSPATTGKVSRAEFIAVNLPLILQNGVPARWKPRG